MARPTKSAVAEASSQRLLRTKTVPDMFSKQKAVASRRRMQESSDEEDELNSSANESESDSDEEFAHEKKKTLQRKSAATSAVLETSSQLLEPLDENILNTQNSLYDYAITPEKSMDDIAKEWIRKYKENNKSALKDLINFVIRSSGCTIAITADAVNQDDGSINAINELQEALSKLPHTEYPIISKTKEHRTLKRNMLTLFQEIIVQCKYDAIYDGILIETLQSWLTTMSSSVYRPFRHTATLVGLKIISALCDVGEKLRDELAVANRQLNNEKKKADKSNNKLRGLKQKSTTAQTKCKDLEEFLTEFFNGIFIHRMRDVESVIRAECIRELCNWMQSYRAYFVDNNYLRFMGWAFNDPSATVRSACIKSLTRLYKIEDIATKLAAFTQRFSSRIEEMALYDVDVSVRVNAIQLCGALFKLKVDVLSDVGRTELSNMIASDVPRIRKSAAPFVKAMLYSDVIDKLRVEITNTLTKPKGRRSAAPVDVSVNENWVFFKGLASYLVDRTNDTENTDAMQVDLESFSNTLIEKRNTKIANIVEALWDQMPEFQEYTSLSAYLCRDQSQAQGQDDDEMDTGNNTIDSCYGLSEDEETILISVFGACIRTAIDKGLDKNIPEGEDKKTVDDAFWEENKSEISRHLVHALPILLSKHSDDATRMTQLASIPAIMNLSVYTELRAETEYEGILKTLVSVYLGAIQTDLLIHCADSLQHLSNNVSFTALNNIHLSILKEGVVNQVREACSGKDLVTARYTPALIHSISVSLHRLACLINFTDATKAMDDSKGMSMNVIEYVGALVDRAAFGHKKEKNIGLSALTIMSRYMMWKCSSLSSTSSSDVIPTIERRRDWTIDRFVEIVTGADVSPLAEVRVTAFGYLVDIYWLFGSDIFDEYGFTRLKTQCAADLQKSLTDYVFEQVQSLEALIKDDKSTPDQIAVEKELTLKLVSSYARGILVGVFTMNHSTALLEQYGSNNVEIDDIVKALVAEFQSDMITGEVAADGICRAYMEALKNSFNANVGESGRSIDKTLKLARLEALSLKRANQIDPVRQVPAQIVCERIHLDGITFALSKAAEAYQNNKDEEKDNALKFFKVLAIFGKQLTRARDIAKIHNHLEDCLQQNSLQVEENQKEWEHYISYIKTLDGVLKKKGLRYDATKRANNAETPAAHVFNDVELDDPMSDINELAIKDAKRSSEEADMDIDDDVTTKKRRD
ncbi:hypothetical protein EDC94DRAFT_310101 [Helicostylum pulchrum]|nr:hypothetical protein EDC94DRAFT_310101 [Helicostylum pulchrum]